MESTLLKLNLGSGNNPIEGYVNVDKFGEPDVRVDLEAFPWPWPDNSVQEVVLNHVMEHLGSTTDIYFSIIRELYRICAANAIIHIAVPHPRHTTTSSTIPPMCGPSPRITWPCSRRSST